MSVRVIVVDDSVVIRRALADALGSHTGIDVVATAVDGSVALRKIAECTPDVVVLDIEMPVMDGLETLLEIRRRWPNIAVIMFSTLTERNAEVSLEAMALGAVDYATKPTRLTSRDAVREDVLANIVPKVLMWGTRGSSVRPTSDTAPSRSYRVDGYGSHAALPSEVVLSSTAGAAVGPDVEGTSGQPWEAAGGAVRTVGRKAGPVDLVVIGSSTGGPDALARLLPTLPAAMPVPVVIVQHMPPVFTAMLAKRLDAISPMPVSESVDREIALPGHIYLAAGGSHLEVHRDQGGFRLSHTMAPKENSCRPAVDVMFRTAARATKGKLIATVLTGMGQDGLLGSRAVFDAGGVVLAQDEASSVVWGMPGFVARDGIASAVLPLMELSEPICRAGYGVTLAGTNS